MIAASQVKTSTRVMSHPVSSGYVLVSQGFMYAIPTYYNSRLYRSRLEARWACFFDQIGLPFGTN